MVSLPLAVRETMKWASVGLTGALNFDEFSNYIEKYLETVEAALTAMISVDGAVVRLCFIQKTAVFWKFPLSKTKEREVRKKVGKGLLSEMARFHGDPVYALGLKCMISEEVLKVVGDVTILNTFLP